MARNTINKDENSTRRSKKELISKLYVYLRPYNKESIKVILLMLYVMFCGVLIPYLLEVAIDDKVKNRDIQGLVMIGVILVVANILALVASVLRWKKIYSITNGILLDIRKELYSYIQKLSFDFFDNRPVGKILARVVGDVNALKNLFDQSIQMLIPQLLNLLILSIAMLMQNIKLGVICILILPILALAMFCIEIFSRRRWEVYRKKRSNLNAFTHEEFSGVKVVQSFANEEDKINDFSNLVKEQKKSWNKAIRLNDTFWPLVELSSGFSAAIVFLVGYKLSVAGEIEVGTLIAFSMYAGMFWRPIMNLSNFYNTLVTNLSAADRIFDVLEIKPTITDIKNAEIMPKIEGNVEFKDVCFAYEDGDKVLNNVSFKVKPGEKVALVGETGAGKSTIVSLLSRFYDVTSGEILVDGKDISKVKLESYRNQMGIMLQDTYLFSTSIKENIRYGRLDATDEEIIEAAKAVNAHEFIMKLEDGYDSEVNERGSRLSLGQRQLISFARALLADPRILILDEATSNIDTQTERLVQGGIEKLLKGRTSFVIAHRLSTIRDCDKIMVVRDGKIVEVGRHEELIKNKKYYYDLYMAQYEFLNEGA
ncbi:MAG: ABC transporter ATP-binding protein/permease [Clostridium sp.]|uniref:ABC transporter ATP-binding protein n=1 Tax=Clostridium sp. DSM 8431 TaxID=1761781 RepID=UPI0008F2154D|nr:ABC transporter ATP-binding protein [Clostridium sp. DSM 8431]MCR4943060.1 ABC transporter ATP-binding protein/permease [Clostridium sp.]SFU43231.1 ATP-binding cassette, subfamily B [Clostridium sp. DSM 8431]